jgi:hypothetical protein
MHRQCVLSFVFNTKVLGTKYIASFLVSSLLVEGGLGVKKDEHLKDMGEGFGCTQRQMWDNITGPLEHDEN